MKKPRTKDDKRYEKIVGEINKHKYECTCGHKELIPSNRTKTICGWCGKYIFKDKESEFKYRLNEKMKGVN